MKRIERAVEADEGQIGRSLVPFRSDHAIDEWLADGSEEKQRHGRDEHAGADNAAIGAYPVSEMARPVEFSPIDLVAKAVRLLSHRTPQLWRFFMLPRMKQETDDKYSFAVSLCRF